MASNINTANIDTDYPRPGEDNPTTGFRTNFTTIKENLDSARDEIEDLQDNTARTDSATSYNGNIITDADLQAVTTAVFEIGNSITDKEVNFSNGSYQTIVVGEDITLTLTGWPEPQRLGKITIALLSDGSTRTVSVSLDSSGVLKKNAGFPSTLEISNDTDPVIVEFWTIDGGDIVFANYLGQFV